ncbi:hypothetical protein Poli38472_005877 [Pythium oligandrum]|uniref:MOSC domain-containing protein n=1 Tax=Pythium oligandrum TaxID=41045 RepID=A0A8K1CRU3_PYTOL|nr:hypothetical protein Poli38472_005877 [Pythium oligandrum]|eukprot:TMW68409.1 hypothetical protein Poli38472_005877 [Pythium oligandrum]
MDLYPVALCGVTLVLAMAMHMIVQRSRRSPSSSPVKSVIQKDPENEATALASQQLFPIESAVNTRNFGPGTILNYDVAPDEYQVQVSINDEKTAKILKADELVHVTVSEIYIYPIKSCRGIRVDHIVATAKGLRNDRVLMFCDTNGKFITQRRYPTMALIVPILDDNENPAVLTLTAKGMPELRVPILREGKGREADVTVWQSNLVAVDQGDAASEWITKFLEKNSQGKEFRFVRIKDSFRRPVDPKYAPDHETVFADKFLYLLAMDSSVDVINKALDDTQIRMDRFRPNIILTGGPVFADEPWNCFTINGLRFRNVKACDRCSLPCVDPATGTATSEPRKAMLPFRNGEVLGFQRGTRHMYFFGSHLIVE